MVRNYLPLFGTVWEESYGDMNGIQILRWHPITVPVCCAHLLLTGCHAAKNDDYLQLKLQVVHEFDLIVNCTGLNAGWLVGDENVEPIKGQVVRVRCTVPAVIVTKRTW